MQSAPQGLEARSAQKIRELEKEIQALDSDLRDVEGRINAFEALIRAQLHSEIVRIRQLTAHYKEQKQAKKARRHEQKKRGKKYREPAGPLPSCPEKRLAIRDNDKSRELKRLYREAIVHVHPDKFANGPEEKSQRATDVTSRLIDIYRSGDLEELKDFHEHIISGNAMAHAALEPASCGNPETMIAYLQKQKMKLSESLEEARGSQLFVALSSGQDSAAFVAEVRGQFQLRIRQLERRTRSKSADV